MQGSKRSRRRNRSNKPAVLFQHEEWARQRLGEGVRVHFFVGQPRDGDQAPGHQFARVEVRNLDVLGGFVVDRVVVHRDCAHGVAVDGDGVGLSPRRSKSWPRNRASRAAMADTQSSAWFVAVVTKGCSFDAQLMGAPL